MLAIEGPQAPVIEANGQGAVPFGARRLLAAHLDLGDEEEPPSRLPRAERPVDVFAVQEESLVELPDGGPCGPPDHHAGAAQVVHLERWTGAVGTVVALGLTAKHLEAPQAEQHHRGGERTRREEAVLLHGPV